MVLSPAHKTTDAAKLARLGDLTDDARVSGEVWNSAFWPLNGVLTPADQSRIADRLGVTTRSVRRKWALWCANGQDEFAVLDHRRLGARVRRSAEFIEWWKALQEANTRSSDAAYREFVRLWDRGEAIPGLDPDRQMPRFNLPRGYSLSNLRRIKPTKFEKATARRGLGYARRAHGLHQFTTRADLWCGSHLQFDDMWHDNFVMHGGQLVRVLEFDCLDLFSGCKVGWGTKPRMRQENGTMEGLGEQQMRYLLASHLFNTGYSTRGTEMICELGTAAIREWLEELLLRRSGGLLTVNRSGITGVHQAIVADWKGKGGGNPLKKGALEALRAVIHSELAALPAQTGLDPEHRPEQTAGLLDYAQWVMHRVAPTLSPDRAKLLRLPVLQYHTEFLPLLLDVYGGLNRRREHDMEGWAEAGLTVVEYRLLADSPDWIGPDRLLSLPPPVQQAITLAATSNDQCIRQRRLSPWEVWESGRRDFVKIPAFVVSEILGPDLAREEKVVDGYIEFEDRDLSPSELRYEARVTGPDGREFELREDTYQVFANPFALDQLFVHDAKGRHVGIARRDRRQSRRDVDAARAHMERLKRRESELLLPQRARNLDRSRANIALREHNAKVVEDHQAADADLAAAADRALRSNL